MISGADPEKRPKQRQICIGPQNRSIESEKHRIRKIGTETFLPPYPVLSGAPGERTIYRVKVPNAPDSGKR